METTKITTAVTLQLLKNNPNLDLLGQDHDSITWYDTLLQTINNLSPIESFEFGINVNNTDNIMIIKFTELPLSSDLREKIIFEIDQANDEAIQFTFLNRNTLIVSLAY